VAGDIELSSDKNIFIRASKEKYIGKTCGHQDNNPNQGGY
jgi:hypothetical protein